MLLTIPKYKLRQTYNTFAHGSPRKRLGWIASIAFIAPYYWVFTRSMIYMYGARYDKLKWEGVSQMAISNLAFVFLFVLISTAALTLYRMFQAKDLPLLMSLPAEDSSLFLAKLSESLVYTARNMVLPFPICISFLSVMIMKARSPFAAIIFAVGWVGIMVQLTCLSVIIALILGRIIISNRRGILLKIVAVVASMVFLLVFFVSYVRPIEPGTSLFRFNPLFAFLPTSWLVSALPYTEATVITSVMCGVGFLAITIACPVVAFLLIKRRFRLLWARSAEVKQRKVKQKSVVRRTSSEKSAIESTRAIIRKEAFVMCREPYTWIGLAILLVLFPVFILFKTGDVGIPVYIMVVSLLATVSYSLSSIGREGRSFALLRSLPIRMSVLLRAKFLLSCAINLVVTLAFVMALYLTGRVSLGQMWRDVVVGIITAVYLSAFGTALAAIFPKFDFTNPIRAASLPGIFTLYLVVILFGVTFVGIISIGWLFTPLVLAFWAGVALTLMKIGWSRLEKMDV